MDKNLRAESGNSSDSSHKIHRSIRINFDFVGRMANWTDCTFNLFISSMLGSCGWKIFDISCSRMKMKQMSWNCYSSTIKTAWRQWISLIDCVICVSSPHFVSMNCIIAAIMHVHLGVSIYIIYGIRISKPILWNRQQNIIWGFAWYIHSTYRISTFAMIGIWFIVAVHMQSQSLANWQSRIRIANEYLIVSNVSQ